MASKDHVLWLRSNTSAIGRAVAVEAYKAGAKFVDVSWFDGMEGDFRLASEAEARAFLEEVMRRATFISYEDRGLIVEEDDAAGRYNWTRRDERSGSILTGTTVYWFSFTSDFRIRSVETIGYIHSVLPVTGWAAA